MRGKNIWHKYNSRHWIFSISVSFSFGNGNGNVGTVPKDDDKESSCYTLFLVRCAEMLVSD